MGERRGVERQTRREGAQGRENDLSVSLSTGVDFHDEGPSYHTEHGDERTRWQEERGATMAREKSRAVSASAPRRSAPPYSPPKKYQKVLRLLVRQACQAA